MATSAQRVTLTSEEIEALVALTRAKCSDLRCQKILFAKRRPEQQDAKVLSAICSKLHLMERLHNTLKAAFAVRAGKVGLGVETPAEEKDRGRRPD